MADVKDSQWEELFDLMREIKRDQEEFLKELNKDENDSKDSEEDKMDTSDVAEVDREAKTDDNEEVQMTGIHLKRAVFYGDSGDCRDHRDWDSAARVTEAACDADLQADVLVEHGRFAFEEKDYQLGESVLLRAERADIAVKLFRDQGMGPDALRVCKEYLPDNMSSLQEEFQSHYADNVERIHGLAQTWEAAGQYQEAVGCYLRIGPQNCVDHDLIEQCWMKAIELSGKFLDEQEQKDLVNKIGLNFQDIDRHTAAATIYLKTDQTKKAVDALMCAEDWEEARHTASDFDHHLLDYVDDCYAEYLRYRDNMDQFTDFDCAATLELHAEQKQWEKCLQVIEKQDGVSELLVNTYDAHHVEELLDEGRIVESFEILKSGAPPYSESLPTYERLSNAVSEFSNLSKFGSYRTCAGLCDMMFDDCKEMADIGDEEATTVKVRGWKSIALLFSNQYLDLREVEDEGGGSDFDTAAFEGTVNIALPRSDACVTNKEDQVTQPVLSVAMDGGVTRTLPSQDGARRIRCL